MRELERKGVLKSKRIVDALLAVDRVDFVPGHMRDLVYADEALPIGYGQTISQPYTVVFMLELLGVRAGDIVFEVGYGSGWQTVPGCGRGPRSARTARAPRGQARAC